MAFQAYLDSLRRYRRSHDFTPTVAEGATATFSYSWFQSNYHPVEFRGIFLPDCRWLLRHSPTEKAGSRAVSNDVDDWLKENARFCKVRWYTEEQWNGSKDWQETPW